MTDMKFKLRPVSQLKVKFVPGLVGPTPSLTIGTVTTLPSGSEATASIDGTAPDFTLNLGIPVGAGLVDEPTQVSSGTATVAPTDTAIAVVRSSPSTTTLTLCSVADRDRVPLPIFDFSTGVTNHVIWLDAAAGETVMQLTSWPLYSNSASLAGATLNPSVDLSGWWIAP